MRCKKILIIPDRAELSSYTKLADRLNLGFEYNDFFIPKLLDDTEQLDAVIAEYEQMSGMPGYCTLHGVFLDVTVFSDDSLIARASGLSRGTESDDSEASWCKRGCISYELYC